jgi:hypothetical protein
VEILLLVVEIQPPPAIRNLHQKLSKITLKKQRVEVVEIVEVLLVFR